MKILGLDYPERNLSSDERERLMEVPKVQADLRFLNRTTVFELRPFKNVVVARLSEPGAYPPVWFSNYITPCSIGTFSYKGALFDALSVEFLDQLDNDCAPFMAALRVRSAGALERNVIQDATKEDIEEAFGMNSAPLTIDPVSNGWVVTAYRKASDGFIVQLKGRLSADGKLYIDSLKASPRPSSIPILRYR